MIPRLHAAVMTHIQPIRKQVLETGQAASIEFKDIVKEIMIDLTSVMLFGSERQSAPYIDG